MKDALLQNKITMSEIIAKANKDLEENGKVNEVVLDDCSLFVYIVLKQHLEGQHSLPFFSFYHDQ